MRHNTKEIKKSKDKVNKLPMFRPDNKHFVVKSVHKSKYEKLSDEDVTWRLE